MERQIAALYTGEDFISYAEYAGGFLFLHCEVKVWNKSTLKKIKEGIKLVKKYALTIGYDKPLFTYTQNPRWVKMIGGVYSDEFDAEDKNYELWKWE
ncbi:hypothetical protein [Citrobacter phage CVT22]|uniref:Uncharacterized protein n=1 Tax=Citrobacter phage CVT22 TaxID=1622234 RepID=A0A0R6CFP0_9CAUD|nr:hypothetical protein APL39_gp12 [Citrobacter phage CVT22]AJT60717.1 hypothetical protein [Citrobacter phage CVT22]